MYSEITMTWHLHFVTGISEICCISFSISCKSGQPIILTKSVLLFRVDCIALKVLHLQLVWMHTSEKDAKSAWLGQRYMQFYVSVHEVVTCQRTLRERKICSVNMFCNFCSISLMFLNTKCFKITHKAQSMFWNCFSTIG